MLQQIIVWLFNLLGIETTTRLGGIVFFFIYDSVKIIILLFFMISLMGFLRTYISQNKIKKWLTGKKLGVGNFIAALFGAVTPFCSCSSIPIFLSFLEAGIPLGVSFSFLITSPLINEYLVVIMLSYFGWKITLAYVISGMLIGIIAGIILGKMKLEKYLVKDLVAKKIKQVKYKTIKSRLAFGFDEASSITKKLSLWILMGVGLGAIIHNLIPEQLIQLMISKAGFFTVPIAAILGVPMYGSCAALVPIALTLFQKGIPIGTALAFMMATAALSLPEAIILRRAMKLRLIGIFFGIVAIAIIFTGYLLNFLQPILK